MTSPLITSVALVVVLSAVFRVLFFTSWHFSVLIAVSLMVMVKAVARHMINEMKRDPNIDIFENLKARDERTHM